MAHFTDALLNDVRLRTSVAELIGSEVRLVRKGREHVGLCPFHLEKTPSFTVSDEKGFYHCFGCGAHGDAFDWLMEHGGLTFPEAVDELAVLTGLRHDREDRSRPNTRPVGVRTSPTLKTRKREERLAWARAIWRASIPATGTVVEVYLASRGIGLPSGIPPTLRYHPSLKHSDTGLLFPTMVGYVQRRDRSFAGIHRTFLKLDGAGKAAVSSQRKMVGEVFGGYLRLCPAASRMLIAEGIETALSATASTGRPTWAALSEGNLGAPLPPIVRELTICADNDTRSPETSARRLVNASRSHAARGLRVWIARPPQGMDFNDLLQAGNLSTGSGR